VCAVIGSHRTARENVRNILLGLLIRAYQSLSELIRALQELAVSFGMTEAISVLKFNAEMFVKLYPADYTASRPG